MTTPTANGTSATANGRTANGHRTTLEEFGPLPPTVKQAAAAVGRWLAPTEPIHTPGLEHPAEQPTTEQPAMHWADELRQWWVSTADRDISGSLDKIVAYGGAGAAYDLVATGHDLAAMNHRKVSDEEAVEIAIAFYLSSKVNRWMAAIIDGRRPSDDTLLDISYYAMMSRRNRAVGGWPIA